MRTRAAAILAVVGLAVGGAEALGAPSSARARTFASCGELIGYAERQAQRTGLGKSGGPQVVGAPQAQTDSGREQAAAPAGDGAATPDFSSTNVQEEGVDEPDVVKTDGNRVFAVAQGRLRAISVRGAVPKPLDSLALDGQGHELLVAGDRILVIASVFPEIRPLPAPTVRPQADGAPASGTPAPARAASSLAPYDPPSTLLSEIDASDPARLRLVRTMEVDGSFVSGRLTGPTARLVISSSPAYGETPDIEKSTRRTWIPDARLVSQRSRTRSTRAVVPCRSVRRPIAFSGLGLLTVLTVDMGKGLPAVDADALLTDAQTVYGSTGGLFVATERYVSPTTREDRIPEGAQTTVHRFEASQRGTTQYRASGKVTGYLLSQFSLSEHNGRLRVASTDRPMWFRAQETRESESHVTVLEEGGTTLNEVGRVSGLGKGERIYAVRFTGDVGYVVTFRQTDPLYTIDLSKPEKPRVVGELKIPGYSAYLHPVADGLVLGVGQDADAGGRVRGLQVSLFDVSDPAAPKRLAQQTFPRGTSSEVEYDHRAFLFWPATRLAVLPIASYDRTPFVGAAGLRITRDIAEVGRVSHDAYVKQAPGDQPASDSRPESVGSAPIRRSLVVGDRLLTFSDAGLLSSRLDTLAPVGFVSFSG